MSISSPICKSKSEARRLIDQGCIYVNGEKITSYDYMVKDGDIIRKGKKLIFKVRLLNERGSNKC